MPGFALVCRAPIVVRLAAVLAPVALAAVLLAIPADDARAHDDTSATLHAETYPLHEAAEAGDLDAVNHFITVHMAEVNAISNRLAPLHYAAGQGHVSVITALIAAGANINVRTQVTYGGVSTQSGATPLIIAAGQGHVAAVSVLIAAGADATDALIHISHWNTAGRGRVSLITTLIAAGANVNVKSFSYWTPLHSEAERGHIAAVSVLIAAGADVNAKNNRGETPLHFAADRGHVSIIAALIAAGADVNVKQPFGSVSPLDRAAGGGHVAAVSALIAAGADDADDVNSALRFAARGGHVAAVSALIAAGANVNARPYGDTALSWAASGGRVSIISTLIAAGADVNAKGYNGDTPLHEAALYHHASAASVLIAAGADVNAKNDDGKTPLHEAFKADIVSVLVAAEADVNAQDNRGRTPLHELVSNVNFPLHPANFSVLIALIAAGADVNARDNRGRTPLHELANNRHLPHNPAAISVLIAAGADVNARDTNQQTPLLRVLHLSFDSRRTVVSVFIAAGGYWGEACANAAVVNPAGPSPPCLCESPNVETNLGACEVVAVCDSPSVLNAGTNRCDCPAPKIGIDGADPPGDCHAETYPLHEAARAGDLDAVNHLITVHMADVNATTSYGDTPLHYATGDGTGVGHVPVVSVLIAAGANVNAKEDEGQVPLHQAAIKGNIPVVSMLIAAGADVNARNGYNQTPLHEAAEGGKAVAISALIAAGASVNVKDAGGGTPLHEAARLAVHDHISVAVFSALIVGGADVNAKSNDGETPLRAALSAGVSEIWSALIAAGGHWGEACENAAVVNPAGPSPPCVCESPNVETNLGACEVVAACASPSVLNAGTNRCDCPAPNVGADGAEAPGECVAASVESCGGLTPAKFYDSAAGECVPFVECASPSVLNAGANLCDCPAPNVGADGAEAPGECVAASVESCGGLTPAKFYDSAAGECVAVAECASPAVLDAGANRCDCPAPNVGADGAEAPGKCVAASVESCGGLTPAKFYDSAAGECVPFVDCHDSAIRKADNTGCECPAGAFAHGDPSIAACHAGHAPIPHSLDGWLSAISAKNLTLVAHFLSGHGQNPDENYHLHMAASEGDLALAKALIAGGANLDRKNGAGDAPLHPAVRNGRAELITLLLRRGADAGAEGDDGDTALHLAARRPDAAENAGLIAFLLDAGADPNVRNDDGWLPLDLAYGGGDARTWQARRGIMAALIDGGANWGDACRGGAIPNRLYDAADVARYPRCGCPPHISERDSFGACECPGHSHAQVNGRCLPKDSAQVEAEILKMETELLRLRTALVSLNARLSAAAEMPREAVEEIAERAADAAQEIKRRRDNFLALARADLAGAPPPPVAMSDTAAECRMLGGEVQIHSATGIRVCSGVDANDTFCLVDSDSAYPCRGLFRHVRRCNDDYNRRTLNPFFCGEKCGERTARGDECE